jgi:hypothetical protein
MYSWLNFFIGGLHAFIFRSWASRARFCFLVRYRAFMLLRYFNHKLCIMQCAGSFMSHFDLSPAVLILGKIDVNGIPCFYYQNGHALREWNRKLGEE